MVKNRNFGQKSKLWSKIEILVKNRNYGQKSKLWSKSRGRTEKYAGGNSGFLPISVETPVEDPEN